MAHVYATIAEADDYQTSGGSVKFAGQSAAIVALKLGILEAVSRLIDEKCERSDFGSGFGPRIGTNRYDGTGRNMLRFRDDLLTMTSVTIRLSTRDSTTILPAADTDYYMVNAEGSYEPAPYRKLILHRYGIVSAFGYGYRVTEVAGVWGHQNVTIPTGTTVASGLAADATATTFTTSASPTLSPGMTLLIGAEQIYLYALSGTTATVVRGVNGTVAATHADASTIARYQYHSQAHEVCLRLYQRRWTARDAGADGADDTMNTPGHLRRESEDTIIRRGLYGLRLKEMV